MRTALTLSFLTIALCVLGSVALAINPNPSHAVGASPQLAYAAIEMTIAPTCFIGFTNPGYTDWDYAPLFQLDVTPGAANYDTLPIAAGANTGWQVTGTVSAPGWAAAHGTMSYGLWNGANYGSIINGGPATTSGANLLALGGTYHGWARVGFQTNELLPAATLTGGELCLTITCVP